MYPLVIVLAMIGIGALMMVYVVPTLTSTFKELGVTLPTSTKIIIAISNTLSSHPIIVGIVALIVAGVFTAMAQTEKGKRIFGNIMLRMPVISALVVKVNAARTARAMASLISSGVNIVEGLTITKSVLQNYRYKAVINEAIEKVQKGEPISGAFLDHDNLYPPLMGEMIAAGEETGKLGEMLNRLAEFYEEEVADQTKDLSSIIEPVILVIIGLGVGFFTVSMIKPLYSVLDTIQ
jgi:type IV pilus assembly protein PilC